MPRVIDVSFEGSMGTRLSGRLHLPDDPPRAHALFAHCFTCGKDLRIASRIAARMSEAGLAVLRFDFTGLGDSEGELAETSFSSNVADLLCAADYLRDHHAAPELLVGHSLGGAAVLAAASSVPEARAVATVAAPVEPSHVEKLLKGSLDEIEARGEAEVDIGGRPFRIGRELIADLVRHDGRERIARLGRALLVLHSPTDRIVGIDNASAIFQAARHPKSFLSLDGADHLLSNPADADYAGRAIATWAGRYLSEAAEAKSPGAGALASGEVRARIGAAGLAVELHAGPHRLLADEPRSVGGTERGPTPYDHLLASLGACTAMTLRMYADRKGLPLSGVDIVLRHSRIHARDCEDCERDTGRIDLIELGLRLEGELTAEQRERLAEIAERCPVHRTLSNHPKVRTTLLAP